MPSSTPRVASVAQITIHRSQFPENVRRDLLDSLRKRQVNHKFHYDSVKQVMKWVRLHQNYSPAKTDKDCAATYRRSFHAAAGHVAAKRVHVISLGCGGGEKDAGVLEALQKPRRELFYTPSDVSVPMVLLAREASRHLVRDLRCFPLVCDLQTADDLPAVFERQRISRAVRLLTFFGMIPNFESQIFLPRLKALIHKSDWLLFSANLAPGNDYHAGVEKILPLYDNALTRDWLITFLLDLGIERTDGKIIFGIEQDRLGLKKVVADFKFSKSAEIVVDERRFHFNAGDTIRLFFSYRHTPALVQSQLARHDLKVVEQWITSSGDEGVFLCKRR